MRVILFDIDGTLVVKQSTDASEGERFRRAIFEEVGVCPRIEPWLYDGMVDPQICRLLLVDVGLNGNAAAEHLQNVIERAGQINTTTENPPKLNEGVSELLKILSVSSRHKLGVLTGNLSVVAGEKLRLTGIRSYFDEMFCSDAYYERLDLARDAIHTCVRRYRLPGNESVTIVGDTPRDVEAAKSNGASCVGVGTGYFSMGELTAAGADAVFVSLSPRDDLLRMLGL